MLDEYARSHGGASLTAAFSLLMNHPTFKTEVMRRMSYEEKLRLFALHEQAVHGDAPPTTAEAGPNAENSSSSAATTQERAEEGKARAKVPSATSSKAGNASAGMAWFDFTGKARQRRWEALRGRMTPQVAREAFCAEFLAMLDRYPAMEVVPLVEAALCRARAVQGGGEQTGSTGEAMGSPASAHKEKEKDELLVFCIRAFQHDPAAMAMLWVCRAHGIPCELTVEPLAKALSLSASSPSSSASRAVRGSGQRSRGRGSSREESDVFYAAASVVEGRVFVPFCTGVRRGPCFVAEVAGVEAGFQLLCDVFLPTMPHWAGHSPARPAAQGSRPGSESRRTASPPLPLDGGHNPNNAETEEDVPAGERVRRARLASEQAEWLEDLASISAHVRTPLMALLVTEAAGALQEATRIVGEEEERQERANGDAAAGGQRGAGAERKEQPHSLQGKLCPQLRALAAHLNHFQRTFVQRKVQRSGFNRSAWAGERWRATPAAASSSSHLLEADAAVKVVDQFYQRGRSSSNSRRLVSCVDLYAACCGYVLCTSPFSQRLFPRLNSVNCEDAAWLATRASAFDIEPRKESSSATSGPGRGAASATSPPRGLPAVRLPGMPAGYNDIINAVLRRESRAALRQLAEPVPLTVSVHAGGSGDSASSGAVDGSPAGEVAAAGVENVSAAADAVGRFLLAQMLSVNEDDITSKAAGQPATLPADLVNDALTPFLVLAHIFVGAWSLSQRQCVGFPFLLTSAKPSRQVNFLWEEHKPVAASHGGSGLQQKQPLRAVPESRLGQQESFGVGSWESRLREVGWAVISRILSPPAARQQQQNDSVKVYRTDGRAQAKL